MSFENKADNIEIYDTFEALDLKENLLRGIYGFGFEKPSAIQQKAIKPFLDGNDIIKIDPRYFRPTEVETLLGDASKAKDKLNWLPKITFEQLVKEMIDEDLKLAKNEKLINHQSN